MEKLTSGQIEMVAEFLARNCVQWPWQSKDIHDKGMLKSMWLYILDKHLGGEGGGGTENSVPGRSGDSTDAGR